MPANSKLKKSSPSVNQTTPPEMQPDPDGFLAQLDDWGDKPNPASFEKLLETNQEKFARALSQGYRAEDICRLAADYGIQVKPSTFRKYWQRLKAQNSSDSSTSPSSQPTPLQSTKSNSTLPDSAASTTANSAVNF